MVDEPTNLIMEQLHILRRGQEELGRVLEGVQSSVDALRDEMHWEIGDLKVRMSGLEMNLAHLQSQFAHFQA